MVVPTRDRPEKLERCLRALAAQTVPIEVVVVDDGSNDGARVASIVTAHGGRVVRLEGAGPAAARNAGVAASRGEVVCFTDDDCEPDRDWAAALRERIAVGSATAAGRTLAVGGAADRAWQAITDHLQRSAASPGSPSPGFAPTCNLACARDLLERVPFDESFPDAAGEDRDWAARVAALTRGPPRVSPPIGGKSRGAFVPQAVVVHHPGLNPASFLRQQYRYGRGAARYRSAAPGRRHGSPSFYAGLLAAGFHRGLGTGLLVLAAQLATAVGVSVERVSARAAARRPARPDRRR